jgi:DNA-binding GntR family transcriptional regulator
MPVRKLSVRDQIRRTLTERILTGHYKPGERLVELTIARELGASQGSVREALRELEASRLVESTPNRGTYVRVVTATELREAYFVRGVLEQAAAATAAKRLKGNVAALRTEAAAILRSAEAGDLAAQAAHVTSVHRAIVAAAGNGVLLRMWEALALETWVRVNLSRGPIDPVRVAASYDAILDALDRGHGRAAGRLLRKHAESFAPREGKAAIR